MINIETHDIPFSFDQPDEVLRSLLALFQQTLSQAKSAAKETPDYRNILIIDTQEQRAMFIAHLLARTGYRSMRMTTALEAFTYFLRSPYVPFAIILGHEDSSNRLFLQRLLQQILQKYHWETFLVKLHPSQSVNTPLPETPKTLGSGTQRPISSPLQGNQSQPLNSPFPLSSYPPDSTPPLTTAPLNTNPSWSQITQPPLSAPSSLNNAGSQTPPPVAPAKANPFRLSPAYPPKSDIVRISLEGQNLGRYHIQAKIGESGQSNVYQTYDRLREQQIALKALQTNSIPYHVMDTSLDETNFFQQEVDLVHTLNHDHILPLWNSGKSYVSGNPFVYKTMPYCQEGSLAEWLHKQGNATVFAPREVSYLISQLADALQCIHDHQIIFQNIKLSNIFIRDKAKGMRNLHVLLGDFAVSQDGTFLSRTHAAYPYMAPERWAGQAFPASDQYGIAVIAYELLAGRPPFQGNAEHIMKRLHINMQPQPPSTFNPALSPAVNNVILRALAKRPEDRFPSIADFANTLQRYCP